jgi:hypothetical protein
MAAPERGGYTHRSLWVENVDLPGEAPAGIGKTSGKGGGIVSIGRFFGNCVAAAIATAVVATGAFAQAAPPTTGLILNGGFSKCKTSGELRRPGKGKDWYESRRDGKGHGLLFLSKKPVAGNVTEKAMIKSSATLNTYLSQMFASPVTGEFTLTFDILVKEILPPANRSAFFMIGDNSDKKAGPNSTAAERFVFMGFENTPAKKMNFFARQGNAGWDQKTIVASGLEFDKWYTIEVTVHTASGSYEASVKGSTTQPVTLKAFAPNGKFPKSLLAVSFASWNDGPGTFYIDNVSAIRK